MSFEIRVICSPADMVRISTALSNAFQTGLFRSVHSRDAQSRRLYVTADHHPAPEPWTTPEDAYTLAPGTVREIAWTARTAREVSSGTVPAREFWLRKAALLDRIALQDDTGGSHGEACEVATEAARRLVEFDRGDSNSSHHGTPYRPDHPASTADPRGYVRQEYAAWAKHQ
ncbi:hypothetical protein [Streptomyces sp. NPDC101455]|uniref:hypothetical protein n=1 Tax=Streptomyces sp. NPDC101455 TaxID=3366142 RepID=UPI00382AFE7A